MFNMSNPLVSIIAVNYKQSQVTFEFVRSILAISYTNFELYIVDNGSDENIKEQIESEFKSSKIKVIVSNKNLGFAGGNNLAIEQAKGKYLLFINNDTEVNIAFLEPLIETLENNKDIGMISPKIIFHNTDNLVQYAGSGGINTLTGRAKKKFLPQKDIGQFDKSHYTELGHGAAMMVPMEVIKKVGMMPDLYFLYYEEHDWCEMIKRAGYKVYYEARSTVYHKESVSVGKSSPLKTYYLTRNRLLFMRRNVKGLTLVINLLFFFLASFPINIIKYIKNGNWSHLKVFIDGVWWNFTHFKGITNTPQLK